MPLLLFIIQLVAWFGSAGWLISDFQIENTFTKVAVFGITGIASAALCTFLAMKVGVLKPYDDMVGGGTSANTSDFDHKTWKDKVLADCLNLVPQLDALWVGATMTQSRINHLRVEMQINPVGRRHQKLTAFYLGAVHGDICMLLNMSGTSIEQSAEIVIKAALYTAAKNDVITSDPEWASLATEYFQFYSDPDNIDMRVLGMHYSGLFEEDPEIFWTRLVAHMKT